MFGGFAKTTNIPALCAAFPDFGVMADVAAGLASAAPFSGRTVSASS